MGYDICIKRGENMASLWTDKNGKHHVFMSKKEWAERAARKAEIARHGAWLIAQHEAHGHDVEKWEPYK